MSSQEAIEECQRRRGLNYNDSTDQESQNNVVVRPDSRAYDSFEDDVNELLEMLDRESNEQDQTQEVVLILKNRKKEQEAVELSDHESNDQNLLSEPEPDQPNEPELHWDDDFKFPVEVSVDNEESYQQSHYFRKLFDERAKVSSRPPTGDESSREARFLTTTAHSTLLSIIITTNEKHLEQTRSI